MKAKIVVQRKINPMTEASYEVCHWVGNRCLPAEVDMSLLLSHDLPWPYEVLSYRMDRPVAVIQRLDTPPSGYVWNRLAADADKISEWWQFNILPRLILTAQVWGLAYVPLGEIPSSKHLGNRPWWT